MRRITPGEPYPEEMEELGLQKSKLRVDWRDARAKLNAEGRCRVCKSTGDLEVAHVIGRRHDAILVGPKGGEYVYVHPDSIVPLCGQFTENNCHALYDLHRLDLLPYLTVDEQRRAVEDAGGIISALRRVSGPEYGEAA